MSTNPTALPFESTEDGNRITVRFPADTALTESNAEELHRVLSGFAEGREQAQLAVDLSGVTVLTSVILSKFLALHKRLRGAGGRLVLLNPTSTIHTVFKVTRLDTVFDIQTSAPEVTA